MVRQTTTIRQQQMVEATRRLITDRGTEAGTIDAIAETVGFSESDINRHFRANNRFVAN